ncbi:hypothetical protein UFOVP131_15 [uncultured Caudovirales phage]|uniref:Uncharacterized protein n=1 Tax=uncultured Caudovirales phage TaxID=2100421 RepID=A0A6J5LBA6_9CAUD|nr:hypothetical protein UFOVP131_15 [uncultured Caudovirales phage]
MFIDDKYVQAGFTAGCEGLPATANPLLFDAQPRRLWEAGHSLALLLSSDPLIDNDELERVSKEPEDQGVVAFRAGVKLEDNPYGFGDPHGTSEEVATNAAHTAWDKSWRLAQEQAGWQSPEPAPGVYSEGQAEPSLGPLHSQRFGRGFRDVKPRMVPLVNQLGEQVGVSRLEIDKVDCFTDSNGTCWTPPTAWAYMAACRALHMTQDRLTSETVSHAKRVSELLAANNAEVERRRVAEAELADYRSRLIDDGK